MPIATAYTVALQGAVGHLVDVQVDVSQGVVATTLVGRADASIAEGRDRCRTALGNSGFEWPSTRRLTILLSPADLPKRGSHFDLAIAVGVVFAADKRLERIALDDSVFIGELTLDGQVRPVPGVLAMAMAAAAHGRGRVFVPEAQLAEAAMVPNLSVIGVRSLAQAVAVLAGWEVPEAAPVPLPARANLLHWRGEDRMVELDLADLHGLEDEKYALEVAAAGGHHLLLSGPKGAGKTSLAERLPGLLPDLEIDQALELTAVLSLGDALDVSAGLVRRPPFSAPHHSASRASLLGGGSGRVRPGTLSRCHGGVVMLDEFPFFNADILEALRQPLESGEITLARGEESATFPAGCMFVLACNPCPCGNYTAHPGHSRCDCEEAARRRYRRKLSGPLIDRLDIVREVMPAAVGAAPVGYRTAERSATVRARVTAARERQTARFRGRGWRVNAQAPGPLLTAEWPLTAAGSMLVERAVGSGLLTQRGRVRVHRLAWSVADLAGAEVPDVDQVAVAIALRTGEPLPASVLAGAGR
ncbi:YifB family Mg chelatase-like AAA ATPase [Nocardioides sp. Bht2]|uniref:YifB family Mg chelatase-like AAA ATPase n=1 Tax=Nocardioides sp. Bht2 TaxID=3392297 RepID=UPI0039B4012A